MNRFLAVGIIVVALIGLVSGVLLVQRQQQLKSKAAECTTGSAGSVTSTQASCVLNMRSDILPFYQSNGWCTNSSTYYPGIVNNWMGINSTADDNQVASCFGSGSPCQTSNWQLSNQSPPPNATVQVTTQGSGNTGWQNVQLRDNGQAVCGVGTSCDLSSWPPTGPTIIASVNSAAAGSTHNLTITTDNGAVTCSGSASFTTSSPSPTSAPECRTLGSKRADVCGGALEVYNECSGRCVDGKKFYFCTDTRNRNCTNEPDGVWCSPEDSECAGSPTTTPTPPAGGGPEGSVCSFDILDSSGKSVKSGPVYETENYTFKITMLNTVREGKAENWKKETHTLQALNNTASIWGIPQSIQMERDELPQGQSTVFDIDIVASPLPAGDKDFEDRLLFLQMVGPNGPFGSACEPQIRILRKEQLISTKCYVISESATEVNEVTDCDHPSAKPYLQHNATINFQLSDTPGQKTIYVKFLDNNNRPSNNGTPFTKKLIYSPDPEITDVDCSYDASGLGTVYTITGSGFATQTVGSKVRIGSLEGQIVGWNSSKISARVDQRLDDSTTVQVVLEDGRSASGSCTVGLTTAELKVVNQCVSGGQSETGDVEIKIYSNGPEPFVKQTLKTDKEGKVQGFAPKLEKNKTYSAVIKAPGALSKKVDFSTGTGTAILGPVVLPAGNIAPSPLADNIIKSFDVSALYSQWSLVKDVSRPADLNKDLRVNSVDYACMKLNFNKQDEVFTGPPPVPTPTVTP
ncbi:MAG: IPT/TIG domain-containing protein, partial [Candidatus Blackburnbacteria bacterium]|nr:IPT/TIG domain-containing protein [Candidatus Blackburnbacteria bacterium]